MSSSRVVLPCVTIGMLLSFATASRAVTETGLIQTTSGPVQGTRANQLWVFLGIPYATPPVGALRWRRPQPPEPWTTPLVADSFGPACVQDAFLSPCGAGAPVIGSEDCLTLNVWAPGAAAAPRPVMVYLHGGAFGSGCAHPPAGDAATLALAGDVLVVTVEYRLGSLGFFAITELAQEDPNGSAGNYGLLDQLAALAWVQDNIAAFGGDPGNVTVFGESAGGTSVCVLLASPLSRGLFARAIVQSGICGYALPLETTPGALPPARTAFGRGDAIADELGCRGADRLACLRGVSGADVMLAPIPRPGLFLDAVFGNPFPWPAIDDYVLAEQPALVYQTAAPGNRDVIVGTTANEMSVFIRDADVASAVEYEARVRALFGDRVAEAVLSIYPVSSFAKPAEAFRSLAADLLFVCPSLSLAEALTAAGNDVYLYHFTHVPRGSACDELGAFHTLDLRYLFDGLDTLQQPPLSCLLDAVDTDLTVALQTAWTSFAGSGTPVSTPGWPLFDPAEGTFLNLGTPFRLEQHLRQGRCRALLSIIADVDPDGDYVVSENDNCRTAANSDQADRNENGIGDACEPTATPSPSATRTLPPTPTSPALRCIGDCGLDRTVTIDELIRAVRIALGVTSPADCRAADADGNNAVSVNELVGAVRNALHGCGGPSN